MKTFIYFILTLCLSCGCLIAATNVKSPYILFTIAFGSWAVFFWGWFRRLKKQAERRSQEQLFADYMRSKLQNDRKRH